MKRFMVFFFLVTAAVMASAAPTEADKAWVEKYKTMDFSSIDVERLETQGDYTHYKAADGTEMWVAGEDKYDDLYEDYVYTISFMRVVTPDQVEIRIAMDNGRETSRILRLPDGRRCTVKDAKIVDWDLVTERAPDFDLDLLGGAGKKVKLSDCTGKPVMLIFWAPWCKPCLTALPKTEAWYEKYKDNGLQVFGIDIENDAGAASSALKSAGISFPILMGGQGTDGKYGWSCRQISDYHITAIPRIFLISSDGVVLTTDVDEKAIEGALRRFHSDRSRHFVLTRA